MMNWPLKGLSHMGPKFGHHCACRQDVLAPGRADHDDDVIMGAMASQITSLTIVYSTIYSDDDQRKHQSSASQAFVRGIHRGPVNSLHKWPVTRKMFPLDNVIMNADNTIFDTLYSTFKSSVILNSILLIKEEHSKWPMAYWGFLTL